MNNKLTKLITERLELLETANAGAYDIAAGNTAAFVTSTQEITNSEPDTGTNDDTVLVDYDFDDENQTEFNVFMTIRYFWKDWSPLYSEIF